MFSGARVNNIGFPEKDRRQVGVGPDSARVVIEDELTCKCVRKVVYSSQKIETMSDAAEEHRPEEGLDKGDDSSYELKT